MTDRRIPVLRPLLPDAAALLPYLQEIDANRWYSNHGPLHARFRRRLGEHFNLPPAGVTLVSNGTVGLTIALLALGVEPGKRCLLPAWTFIGTVAAVCSAHLKPHFVDVDERSWTLDLEQVSRRDDLQDVGAVILVSAFGAPVDRNECDRFTQATGIPVLIDAAAGFDGVATIERARPGRTPIMISLHATKSFGIGEGGVLLSSDLEFSARAEQYGNFGFSDRPDVAIAGGNAKLSEYHAAVGLAALDQWTERRQVLDVVSQRYRALLERRNDVALSPDYGHGWVSSYCCIRVPQAADAVERLERLGIETRRWWRRGCHRFAAYRDVPSDPLPVTDQLADDMIGLPFFVELNGQDQSLIVDALCDPR